MQTTIYTLAIEGFPSQIANLNFREITNLTFPLFERYAKKIGAEFVVLTERKFPEWPITYEKLQIHDVAEGRGDDWSIFFDADALVHPDMPDLTQLVPRDHVAHNGTDHAAIRWRYDKYFQRDGRHIGSCNWFAMASALCRDLWRPLDDLTPAQAEANITPTVNELKTGFIPASHLIDDYTLSRNIARFGLKVVELRQLWQRIGLHDSNFLWHEYTIDTRAKVAVMTEIAKQWKLI